MPQMTTAAQVSSAKPHSKHIAFRDPERGMNFFRRLSTRKSKGEKNPVPEQDVSSKKAEAISEDLDMEEEAPPPPAYTANASSSKSGVAGLKAQAKTSDSPFAFLGQFDTIFLIDDSGSMTGRSWQETSDALSAISPIITEHDADGIDIYFLNHRNPMTGNPLGGYENITTTAGVQEIFKRVGPCGGTPTGTRLNSILKTYLAELTDAMKKKRKVTSIKPLNIIVITDGVATDDVESSIVSAARQLDKLEAEPWQVGIQFFQVGFERAAAQDLQELDDVLAGEHGVRDMVDTVPWNGVGKTALTADGIMKVTMGAINRRLDRKSNSDARLRG